jgi:hypothetical protein
MAVLLIFFGLASCASMFSRSDSPVASAAWHRRQVQLDVEAIAQGMDHARAQSEAVARARARVP